MPDQNYLSWETWKDGKTILWWRFIDVHGLKIEQRGQLSGALPYLECPGCSSASGTLYLPPDGNGFHCRPCHKLRSIETPRAKIVSCLVEALESGKGRLMWQLLEGTHDRGVLAEAQAIVEEYAAQRRREYQIKRMKAKNKMIGLVIRARETKFASHYVSPSWKRTPLPPLDDPNF